jgi:dipeptidyl aminopeptidase/acylaminoacyl peptidase
MAPRPKVPFVLHPAARLRGNLDIAHGAEAVLSPDGATLAVVRGDWSSRQLDLHHLADGTVETVLPPAPDLPITHFTWSRDGRRWAVVSGRHAGDVQRGVVQVGEVGRAGILCRADLSEYSAVTRNALARPASTLAFSPDGDRVVVRVSGRDREGMLFVNVPDGAVHEAWSSRDGVYRFAHAFADDGTLYVAGGSAGPPDGVAVYAPGATTPHARLPDPYGFALVNGARGLWVVGAPRFAFRLGDGAPQPCAGAAEARKARAEALRLRASAKWDVQYLDYLLERVRDEEETRPEGVAGVRAFEHEMFWETSYAGRLGDDDLAIGDGVSVYLWRDRGATLDRTLLVDDAQRCAHRTARIVGLSTAGDTLCLLWRKDASGAKTVASLIDLDRLAL